MAERRMFAKTIVLSDAFLDMPLSARCLYFTLGMLADDDGFVNAPKSIMRQCGASNDDMNMLLAKKFLLLFDSGVIVIKHWRINNYLRNDRYTETKYIGEKSQLSIEDNGAYHIEEKLAVCSKDYRKEAYKNSELPYSFEYKIRHAFMDKPCPICGTPMRYYHNAPHRPTIQHNIPISKGGKHELSNISVICHACNISIQDKETPPLNNEEVVKVWSEISGIPNSGIPSIGKDSIGKDSLGKGSKKFTPPTLKEIEEYVKERNSPVDAKRFFEYYESGGWKDGKGQAVKNWKQKLITWEQHDSGRPAKKTFTAATATPSQKTVDDLDHLLETL